MEKRINLHFKDCDFDLDGDIDIVFGDNSGKLSFLLNNDGKFFLNHTNIADFGSLSWGICFGDINDDGILDLVVSSDDEVEGKRYGKYYFLRNISDFFYKKNIIPEKVEMNESQFGPSSLEAIDIDDDGEIEILSTNGNKIYLLKNFSMNLLCEIPHNDGFGECFEKTDVASGDIDNDGDIDFVLGSTQGVLRIFINK